MNTEYQCRNRANHGRPEFDWSCAVADAAAAYRDAVDLRDLVCSIPSNGDWSTTQLQVGPYKLDRAAVSAILSSAVDAAKAELDALLADKSHRGYAAFAHSESYDSTGRPRVGALAAQRDENPIEQPTIAAGPKEPRHLGDRSGLDDATVVQWYEDYQPTGSGQLGVMRKLCMALETIANARGLRLGIAQGVAPRT